MSLDNLSLPFTRSAYEGLPTGGHEHVAYFGVLRVDGDNLVVEYRARRTSMATLKSYTCEVQHLVVPLVQLATAALRRRVFRASLLLLETNTMGVFERHLGGEGVHCTLAVARKDAERARAFVAELEDRITDVQLRRLEGGAGAA